MFSVSKGWLAQLLRLGVSNAKVMISRRLSHTNPKKCFGWNGQ